MLPGSICGKRPVKKIPKRQVDLGSGYGGLEANSFVLAQLGGRAGCDGSKSKESKAPGRVLPRIKGQE
ncbi:hypothetical protein N7528_008492 [Penicillium herquei]|nr:hypothetical protein N7528_008492 [Penicillium herquei]